MIAGSPLLNQRATWAVRPLVLGELELVVLPGLGPGQAGDHVGVGPVERVDDRVLVVPGVELERPLLDLGVADDPAERGGQQPLAVGEEDLVVVLGDHLVAAEDDDPAPLLQVGVERGDLGRGELGDVAEDHRVERGQVAAAELRLVDDLGPDLRGRARPTWPRG